MTDQTTTSSHTAGSAMSPPGDHGTSDDLRSRASDVADSGKHEASRVVDEAKAHTSRLVGETGDRAREHADQQLGRAAGVIDQLGNELQDMAANSSQPDGYLVALARDGAQSAQRLSQRLENGGFDGVVDDIARFARRRPGTFLAASFAIGLGLGRLTRNADLGRIKQEVTDGDDTESTSPRTVGDAALRSPAGDASLPAPGAVSATAPGFTT